MGLQIFTAIHVIISLVAIFSGFAVFRGLLKAATPHPWTGLFLNTTIATSVTGFLFAIFPEFRRFSPAYAFGIISMVVLTMALYALRTKNLAGGWRKVYIITALFALYLNVFVLIVQTFQKVTPLHALVPLQNGQPSGPVFGGVQGLVLVLFVVFGTMAARRFRRESMAAA
jgi:hypothetical protein